MAAPESPEERIRRIFGGAPAPQGTTTVLQETSRPANLAEESPAKRVERIFGGGSAAPEQPQLPSEMSSAVASIQPMGAPKTFSRGEAVAPPPVSLPTGMKEAPKDESPAKSAARGVLRTVQTSLDLLNRLDPWIDIKRAYGFPVFPDLMPSMTKAVGIDLSEIQTERNLARFTEKLGEEGSAAAIMAVPVFRGARAAQGTTLVARKFIGPVLRYASEQPLRFTASEVASAVGAAYGRSRTSEGYGSQMAGGALGAVAPAAVYAPLRKFLGVPVGNLVKHGTVFAQTQTARIRGKAGREILQAVGGTKEAGEEAAGALEKNVRLFGEVTGQEPSTVQAVGYQPGLREFEKRRSAFGNQYAVSLNKALVAKRAKVQESVVNELNDIAQLNRFETGDGSLLARLVEDEPPVWAAKELTDTKIQARADQAAALMEKQIVESQDRVLKHVMDQTGGVESSEFSMRLRDALEDESERVFQPFDDVYDDLDSIAGAKGAYVSNSDISRTYTGILSKSTVAEGTGLPGDIERALKTLTGKMQRPSARKIGMGEYIPFSEVRGLKRRINRELRSLGRQPEGRTSASKLMQVKRAINKTLDMSEDGASKIRFVEGEGADRRLVSRPAEAADIAQTYISNDRSFSEAATRFREGVTGRILEPQKAPPAASATAGLYFRPGRGKGQIEAAQSFKRAAGDNPELRGMMDDYIISRAWEATNHPEKGPVLENLRRFKLHHRDALSEFPETAEKLKTLEGLIYEADKRQLEKVAWKKSWERSAAGRWLGKDPTAAVKDMMKRGPSAARQLMQQIGDNEGRRGIAQVMWSEIYKKSVRYGDLGPGTSLYLEPNSLYKIIDEHAPMIRVVQGQDHVDRIRRMARLAEMAFYGKIPETARAIGQRNLSEALVKAPIGWTYNRIYNLKTRVIRGSLYGLQWMAKRDRAQVEELLDRALIDPALAKDLLSEAIGEKAQKAVVRRLRGNLISMGYRVPEIEETEQ